MTIKLVLYGNLKKKVKSNDMINRSPLKLDLSIDDKIYTIYDILKELGLKENEISHIFVNGKYCGMGTQLTDSDRVGIFGRDMGLIFAEIEKNNSIKIHIRLPKNLEKKFHKSEAFLSVPRGSNVRYLLKKFNISEDFKNLQILVNDNKVEDLTSIVKEGDFVRIAHS